jgi:SAM-dependent methyltransferase
MFFPRKAADFAEARRVLKPGGRLLFSTWDRIEDNEFADVVTSALGRLFPAEPPRFLTRTPHGYFDKDTIVRDLASAGFHHADFATVTARSRAASSREPAIAYCEGTPLRNEIEASRLAEATDASAKAIAARFGHGAVDGKMQALVVGVVV